MTLCCARLSGQRCRAQYAWCVLQAFRRYSVSHCLIVILTATCNSSAVFLCIWYVVLRVNSRNYIFRTRQPDVISSRQISFLLMFFCISSTTQLYRLLVHLRSISFNIYNRYPPSFPIDRWWYHYHWNIRYMSAIASLRQSTPLVPLSLCCAPTLICGVLATCLLCEASSYRGWCRGVRSSRIRITTCNLGQNRKPW